MDNEKEIDHHQVLYEKNFDTIVLLHGLAASSHDWDDLTPILVERGYRVFSPDLPGHNNNLISDDQNYNLEYLFSYLCEFLQIISKDKKIILMGHSLGGYLAVKFTVNNPEKIKALILCNPLISLYQLPLMLRIFYGKKRKLNFDIIRKLPLWMIKIAVDFSSYSIRNGYNLSDSKRDLTAQDYLSAQPGIYNFLYGLPDLTSSLKSIQKPTLLIFGKNDITLDPKLHNKIKNNIPGCIRSVTITTGHVPHQSMSRYFNEIVIRFLEKIS